MYIILFAIFFSCNLKDVFLLFLVISGRWFLLRCYKWREWRRLTWHEARVTVTKQICKYCCFILTRKWKRGYFSVENTQTEWGAASAALASFDFGLLNDCVKALMWSGWDTTVANLVHWRIGSNLTDVYVSPAVSTWQITSEYRHTTDVCKVLHICSAKVHYHLVISGVFLYRVSVSRCCTTWHYVRQDYNEYE